MDSVALIVLIVPYERREDCSCVVSWIWGRPDTRFGYVVDVFLLQSVYSVLPVLALCFRVLCNLLKMAIRIVIYGHRVILSLR